MQIVRVYAHIRIRAIRIAVKRSMSRWRLLSRRDRNKNAVTATERNLDWFVNSY